MSKLGMCLGCSGKPAVRKDGTVPLCQTCYEAAKGNARGVQMKGKKTASVQGTP
jgi:hypothetical protein